MRLLSKRFEGSAAPKRVLFTISAHQKPVLTDGLGVQSCMVLLTLSFSHAFRIKL